MAQAFSGFPPGALKFLRQLKRNNSRDWFHANKAVYERELKAPMEEFVEALNAGLARYAAAYITEPKKAVYRIYRDTRFSSDKTPYKTHAGALFRRPDLPKHESAAFYAAISPEEVEIAGGVYMPSTEALGKLRRHIGKHHSELEALLSGKKLVKLMGEIQGNALSRPPKGISAGHPAIEILKRKQWYFYATLPAELALKPVLLREVETRFEVMTPVVEFLNRAFAEKARPALL
jgi:uncharacterized protein (TIGR02453 family)